MNRGSSSAGSSTVMAIGIEEHALCVGEAHVMLAEVRLSLAGIPDRHHVCIICICSSCGQRFRLSSDGPTRGLSRAPQIHHHTRLARQLKPMLLA